MEIVEEEEEDDAMVRWAVNTSLWRPTDQEFHSCLALLPPPEWPSVQRFVPWQTLLNYEALTQIFLMTFLQQFFFHNRVILFNWELVVLHSSPRMFGEFSVHAWKCGVSEWRTYYIASLRVKLILACSEEVLKWGYSSFRFKHYLRACTITSGKVLLVSHAKQPMENHRGPNPCKSSHWVEV